LVEAPQSVGSNTALQGWSVRNGRVFVGNVGFHGVCDIGFKVFACRGLEGKTPLWEPAWFEWNKVGNSIK
jgi:hypothetical protein